MNAWAMTPVPSLISKQEGNSNNYLSWPTAGAIYYVVHDHLVGRYGAGSMSIVNDILASSLREPNRPNPNSRPPLLSLLKTVPPMWFQAQPPLAFAQTVAGNMVPSVMFSQTTTC
jgi:hypothetical protein